jgi:signal transduction histidine kinase
MIKPRAEKKGIKLALEISRQAPRSLNGDEARIRQIIGNLLMNAVRYTEKGEVTFCVRYEKISDEPDSVMLKIVVKDTGAGIRKEEMRTLFSGLGNSDTLSQQAAGTVLSLSITKQLLEMMDSTLIAESIYGLGSKFSFELKQSVVKWDELGDCRPENNI